MNILFLILLCYNNNNNGLHRESIRFYSRRRLSSSLLLKNRQLLSSDPKTVAHKVPKFQKQEINYLDYDASHYRPSLIESNAIQNKNFNSNSGCVIWKSNFTTNNFYSSTKLGLWKEEFDNFVKLRQRTKNIILPDIRKLMNSDYSNHEEICSKYTDVVPGEAMSLKQYFPNSYKLLSYSEKLGYMEPLVPPLRHYGFCIPGDEGKHYIGNLDYILHDFGHMCRHSIQHSTKTVFIDMGANYNFNKDMDTVDEYAPTIRLINTYRRHGIHFDHIYAYELTPIDTERVYKTTPTYIHAALHWINTGVNAEINHLHNPFTMIKERYTADDFVVIKLDIDTVHVELPLVLQLLKDEELHKIVNVFYFEHHVDMEEMYPYWGKWDTATTKLSTITESLQIFSELRRAGIASHYWI